MNETSTEPPLVQKGHRTQKLTHLHFFPSDVQTHISKLKYALYRMRKIIVFSLFVLLLLYLSRKENIPKCSAHFACKDILSELLS